MKRCSVALTIVNNSVSIAVHARAYLVLLNFLMSRGIFLFLRAENSVTTQQKNKYGWSVMTHNFVENHVDHEQMSTMASELTMTTNTFRSA